MLSLAIMIMLYACSGETAPVQTPKPADFETSSAESGKPGETPDANNQTALPGEKSYCFDFRRSTEGALMHPATSIFETDDSIYYLSEGMLYFSDKTYKEFFPLCAKPNCNHKNKDCDAMIDPMQNSIFIYDRYIYYFEDNVGEDDADGVSYPSLCRMRLDGSQHEEVMRLPAADFGYTPLYNSWLFIFSNKYIYINYNAREKSYSVEGDDDCTQYVLNLETMEVKTADNGAGVPVIFGSGEMLYCLSPEQENEVITWHFIEFNLETYERRVIGYEHEWLYLLNDCVGVKDGEILYVTADRADLSAMRLWGMDIETGEKRLHYSTDNIYSSKWHPYLDYTNGYYLNSYKGYNDGPEEETRPNWGLYVTDTSGNVVSKFLHEDMPEDFFETQFLLQTESYIFAGPPGEDGGFSIACSIPTWYLDKSEIAAGKPEWRRWAPED